MGQASAAYDHDDSDDLNQHNLNHDNLNQHNLDDNDYDASREATADRRRL
jgi:hypothetical protein